ncbi:MAG: hypothetical protein ABMB14_25760 [Myxococcota bacterium]
MIVVVAWAVAPADAACPRGTSSAELVALIEGARSAYGNLDMVGFHAAMVTLDGAVPCLTDEVTAHLAAEVHRYQGLRGFLDRNPTSARTAFAAARALEPNFKFPESLVPAGNPVLVEYVAIDPDAGVRLSVADPVDGRILFDGRPIAERPRDFPTLVQLVDGDGQVSSTGYLWPGDPLPSYAPRERTAAIPVPAPATTRNLTAVPGPRPVPAWAGPNKGLLTVAAVGAVTAGALYGGAFVVHGQYDRPEASYDTLDGLRTTNNTLVLGSAAALVATLGFGTTAFLVGQF